LLALSLSFSISASRHPLKAVTGHEENRQDAKGKEFKNRKDPKKKNLLYEFGSLCGREDWSRHFWAASLKKAIISAGDFPESSRACWSRMRRTISTASIFIFSFMGGHLAGRINRQGLVTEFEVHAVEALNIVQPEPPRQRRPLLALSLSFSISASRHPLKAVTGHEENHQASQRGKKRAPGNHKGRSRLISLPGGEKSSWMRKLMYHLD